MYAYSAYRFCPLTFVNEWSMYHGVFVGTHRTKHPYKRHSDTRTPVTCQDTVHGHGFIENCTSEMRIRPTLSIVYKTTPEMKYFLNQDSAYAQPDRDVYKITIEMNTSLIQDTAYGIEMYTKLLLIRGHLFNQDLSMVLAEKRGVARSTPEIRTPAIN